MSELNAVPFFKIETQANRKGLHPNQDRAFARLLSSGNISAGMFDGMGGAPNGEVAASIVCDYVSQRSKNLLIRSSYQAAIKSLRSIAKDADKHLKDAARSRKVDPGAGTTGILVFGCAAENSAKDWQIAVASCGDSRAYAYLPSGELQPISIDNSAGLDLIGADQINFALKGSMQEFLSTFEEMKEIKTAEQRSAFTARNIIDYAFFADEDIPTPDYTVSVLNVPSSSRLFLMSDGVSDVLPDRTIQFICRESKPGYGAHNIILEAADRALIQTNVRSKEDDRTVVEVIF